MKRKAFPFERRLFRQGAYEQENICCFTCTEINFIPKILFLIMIGDESMTNKVHHPPFSHTTGLKEEEVFAPVEQ